MTFCMLTCLIYIFAIFKFRTPHVIHDSSFAFGLVKLFGEAVTLALGVLFAEFFIIFSLFFWDTFFLVTYMFNMMDKSLNLLFIYLFYWSFPFFGGVRCKRMY